jgi:hypothetical protein
MIKPIIRDFSCIDIDNIEAWVPEDSTDIDFWFTLMIGVDEHGGDNFDLHVVSPKNLKQGPQSKKYAVVINDYSWTTLIMEIDEILTKCKGYDWQDISSCLSKYFHWEYEGMVPPYSK